MVRSACQAISTHYKSADSYFKKSCRSLLRRSVSSVSLLFGLFMIISEHTVYNHVKSANLKAVDLTEEDIAELKNIDKTAHFRAVPPSWTGWGNLGFTD